MYLMYLLGSLVLGPSSPSRCRICVERNVNSQSSMNSQRWERPASLASGISCMRTRMEFTMAFLYSKPPSSRSTLLRKFMSARCFCGNLRQRDLIASTTTILKSSAMSDMKLPICLSNLSTLDSLPVLSKVVMAKVAMDLFWSAMRLSMSMLQLVTASGCVMATLLRVRTAAKRSTGFELERNSWSTVIAGVSSRVVTSFRLQIARAASKITISALCLRQLSRKS
mmetsp:Transcript_25184/g.54741  ORF Transcript_25184/g.54741 Transcript_25184/m.54741 type:complete len:225 (+) Transcript_25184:1555-2229(+)